MYMYIDAAAASFFVRRGLLTIRVRSKRELQPVYLHTDVHVGVMAVEEGVLQGFVGVHSYSPRNKLREGDCWSLLAACFGYLDVGKGWCFIKGGLGRGGCVCMCCVWVRCM